MIKLYCFLGVFALLSSCSHLTGGGAKTLKGPVALELQAPEKSPIITDYYTKSLSQQVKSRAFATEQESELSFVEVRRYLPDASTKEAFAFEVTTKNKKGDASLSEMAFPEPGESIVFRYNPDATVLEAGDKPKNSVFFMPMLSLPSQPVSVGDTWTAKYSWISEATGVPFVLDIVTIFKEVRDCDGSRCAILEVSGNTKVDEKIVVGANFTGEIRGMVHFDIDKGKVVKTDMQSSEQMEVSEVLLRSVSCLRSLIRKDEDAEAANLACEPPSFDDL